MRNLIKFVLVMFLLSMGTEVMAQTKNKSWREMHKVKRKETIYSISKEYGITEEELRNANPEMKDPNYSLRKGDYIFIPYPKAEQTTAQPTVQQSNATGSKRTDVRNRPIRVGMMLPLHDVDGDGRRMVEYYRGFLLACEDLKKEGISTDIHAWNVNIDADIRQTFLENGASDCDIIFGPLYTKQMDHISQFVLRNDIKLVIPFSISGNHVADNPNIFQVYQSPEELNERAIRHFVEQFGDDHIVIIDCNDATSTKGNFTSGLRKVLDARKSSYNITNLNSSDDAFARSFASGVRNVVILNTGRSPELNAVLAKLDALTNKYKGLQISLFGYNEWLMYERFDLEKFYKYDTYVPTHYYYNSASARTLDVETRFSKWFGGTMMNAIPRFGLTGYDQACFFLRGLHSKGNVFRGEESDTHALQTPYLFRKVGQGGMKNQQFMFVHYNKNRTISLITF